jgi:hypothetical protein
MFGVAVVVNMAVMPLNKLQWLTLTLWAVVSMAAS